MTADDKPECTRCGQVHTRCRAHRKQARGGGPCTQHPIKGGTVCKTHGGSSPQARAAATVRLDTAAVTANATALLAHTGIRGITDPLTELARVASEVVAFKDALAARVNALTEIRYTGVAAEQVRAEVALYERALDRTGKFLEILVKAGFEERMTALSERQGALVADVLRAILTDLHLTPEQEALVPTIVPAQLRALTAGVTAGGAA